MPKPSRTMASGIQTLSLLLRNTPLHPQWFAFYREDRGLRSSCSSLKGVVIDIGCADAKPKKHLPPDCQYIGIDYYSTATEWYETHPDLFADAQSLPLIDGCSDHVLLLDVLEHIPDSDRCLAEINRILKPGGSLVIQVPFMYPIHDAPLDFHRWTRFGLINAAKRNGYKISEQHALGHPLESAALNANIAMSKTVLNWLNSKNILGLTVILLPLAVLTANILARVGSALSKHDALMPYSYKMVWVKE
ncbi:MAG TPA: class I SAM-dependent methyltransferase [Gammaproteobacteria bacterium]|nr:class I SAM-dependent methyltransferase [Gammaproteobacteria bacterium]